MLQNCSPASHLLKINLLKICPMCLWLLTTEDNERGVEHTQKSVMHQQLLKINPMMERAYSYAICTKLGPV